MRLGRVVQVRRRVVDPKFVAGRVGMLERRVSFDGRWLATWTFLISRQTRPGVRDGVVAELLTEGLRLIVANDCPTVRGVRKSAAILRFGITAST